MSEIPNADDAVSALVARPDLLDRVLRDRADIAAGVGESIERSWRLVDLVHETHGSTPSARGMLLDTSLPFRTTLERLAADIVAWWQAERRGDPFASRRVATKERRSAETKGER